MATNLLYLPVVLLEMFCDTNADWLDGIEYWDAPQPGGNPIMLDGIAFAMEVRAAPPVATVVLKCTTQNGLIKVYDNTWQLLVSAATMALVPPGDYVFDFLGFAEGRTRNLVQATVTVNQGITRSVIPTATIFPGSGTSSQVVLPSPAITRVIGVNKEAA